jgi:signal transduction histidine kinase
VFHKHPNAGVGLFLTKAQVEGWTITVESMVDVGTKFEIIFKKLQYG